MPDSRNQVARKASKNRRDNEAVEIRQLTELLPLSQEIKSHLDKESLIRLVIAYFRLRLYMKQEVPGSIGQSTRAVEKPTTGEKDGDTALELEESQLLLEALQGFLLVLDKKAVVLYVSENVKEHLGIQQTWMLGRPVVNFIHPDDVGKLADRLDLCTHRTATATSTTTTVPPPPSGKKPSSSSSGYVHGTQREFYLRMRYCPAGAKSLRKPANYQVVQWSGRCGVGVRRHAGPGRRPPGMVCVCRALPRPSPAAPVPGTGAGMFISRHDMRLTFTFCDPSVLYLIGYDPSYLIGRTAYTFHNPVDAHKCSYCHTSLIQTGSAVSGYYRFLGRTGVWVWMQSRASVVTNTKGQPQYIVCNNYIVSQEEGDRIHKMELQQQQKQTSSSAMVTASLPSTVVVSAQSGVAVLSVSTSSVPIVTGDLTVKGAIDPQPFSQVTSPVSSTDGEQDDTGYSSAVSSMGSASASPSPFGLALGVGVGGGAGLVDGDVVSAVLASASAASQNRLGLSLDSTAAAAAAHREKGEEDRLDDDALSVTPPGHLSFHSTLSAAIYGEEMDMGEVGGVSGSPYPSSSCQGMLEELRAHPTPSLTDEQSDPFLCGSRRDQREGSVSHVMEDMELLEDLLERIADCDNSHDSVFAASGSPHGGLDAPSSSGLPLDSQAKVPLPHHNLGGELKRESAHVMRASELSQQPSLLRTLLDKEGGALDKCSSLMETWTKSFPAVSLAGGKAKVSCGPPSSLSSTPSSSSSSSTTHCLLTDSRRKVFARSSSQSRAKRPNPEESLRRGRGGRQAGGKQLMLCGGKQVLVPRQMDLTADDSSSDGEDVEGGGRAVREAEDGVCLPPALPDDLLDFAMQYCDTLSDMETVLPDSIAGLDGEVWNPSVDDIMPIGPSLPDAGIPSPPTSDAAAAQSLKQTLSSPSTVLNGGDVIVVAKASEKLRKSGTDSAKGLAVLGQGVNVTNGGTEKVSAVVPSSGSSLQSAIITSMSRDSKSGAFTISVKPAPAGVLRGLMIQPLIKDKTSTTPPKPSPSSSVAVSSSSLAEGSGSGLGVKCVRLVSPALSDHRYFSSPSPQASQTATCPPSGKRMRTDRGDRRWSAGGDGVGVGVGGGCRVQSVTLPFGQCLTVQHPGLAVQAGSSGGGSSLVKVVAAGGSGTGGGGEVGEEGSPGSQPISPTPAPIPANGGGKPLTAMSELEKHLRGLVAPPDQKEGCDVLAPVEESGLSQSKPFLERLLTGEISHERYRQIDYHLLYQERERRLSENGHVS